MRSIDRVNVYVRHAPLILGECSAQVACSEGRIDANRQSSVLAPAPATEVSNDRLGIFKEPASKLHEFEPGRCRPRSTACSFEEWGADRIFDRSDPSA